MKKSLIIFSVVCLVAILQISYFMKDQKSSVISSEEIYFVVDKVEVSPDSTYAFYDGQGKVFTSYTFSSTVEITKGDIIAKEANSNELTVYRFDSNGKKKVFFKVNMQEK